MPLFVIFPRSCEIEERSVILGICRPDSWISDKQKKAKSDVSSDIHLVLSSVCLKPFVCAIVALDFCILAAPRTDQSDPCRHSTNNTLSGRSHVSKIEGCPCILSPFLPFSPSPPFPFRGFTAWSHLWGLAERRTRPPNRFSEFCGKM